MFSSDEAPSPEVVNDQLLDLDWATAVGAALLTVLMGFSVSALVAIVAEGIFNPGKGNLALNTFALFGLWIGFLLVPLWITRRRHLGFFKALGVKLVPSYDLPYGISVGVAMQFVLVPVLALPIYLFNHSAYESLSKPAEDLANANTSTVAIIVTFITAGLLAPIVEEITFRGFIFGALREAWGTVAGIIVSGALFGIIHFEGWTTFGLAAVGMVLAYCRVKTGRLGLGICAHMAFNCVSLVILYFT